MRITIVLLMCVLFTQARRISDRGSEDEESEDLWVDELSVSERNQIIRAIIREGEKDSNWELSPYSLLKKTKKRMERGLEPKLKVQVRQIKEAIRDYIAVLVKWVNAIPHSDDLSSCFEGPCIQTAYRFIEKVVEKANIIIKWQGQRIFRELDLINKDLKKLGNTPVVIDNNVKTLATLLENLKNKPKDKDLNDAYKHFRNNLKKLVSKIKAKYQSLRNSQSQTEQNLEKLTSIEQAKIDQIEEWIRLAEYHPDSTIEDIIPGFKELLEKEGKKRIKNLGEFARRKANLEDDEDELYH